MATETASSAGTRERILTATNELFRRQGFNGTSLSQIVKASKATTGSLYHFFPGGKDELTAEVLRTSGAAYGDLVELIVRAAVNPAQGIAEAFAGAGALLEESDFIDPCPIGTVAREVASTHEPLRAQASAVISGWTQRFSDILSEAGVPAERSAALATLVVASIEGAFIMCRSHRSIEPMIMIGESLRSLIQAEMDADESTEARRSTPCS